jgi:hypothetical protein
MWRYVMRYVMLCSSVRYCHEHETVVEVLFGNCFNVGIGTKLSGAGLGDIRA